MKIRGCLLNTTKDPLNSASTASKKAMAPMLPIAEPPMTPLHEVSRSIPDYVKFGPILPKSAGFSPVLKSKRGKREGNNRLASIPYKVISKNTWLPCLKLLLTMFIGHLLLAE